MCVTAAELCMWTIARGQRCFTTSRPGSGHDTPNAGLLKVHVNLGAGIDCTREGLSVDFPRPTLSTVGRTSNPKKRAGLHGRKRKGERSEHLCLYHDADVHNAYKYIYNTTTAAALPPQGLETLTPSFPSHPLSPFPFTPSSSPSPPLPSPLL